MTKFPDEDSVAAIDVELKAVIAEVKAAVDSTNRYTARIASEREYHPLLWDNTELFLLGSKRGIAIVEDKYRPELNPNVAMEWGWLRAMGRRVLYLMEKDFDQSRADWSGLLKKQFDWADPKPGIEAAVQEFLAP